MNGMAATTDSGLSFWPRLRRYDGRAIEEALAPPTLFSPGLRLDGAVAEAPFVMGHPPLLDHLREAQSPFLVDPASLRFSTPGFLEVETLCALPYSPESPLTPDRDPTAFVRGALAFQAAAGASALMTPTVRWPGRSEEWSLFNRKIIDVSSQMNGTEMPRLQLVALLAPDWDGLRNPEPIVDPLRDIPIEAAYVQPTTLHPTRDSVEKLVTYVRFLQSVASLRVPVIAGRVGAFGFVLQALGIPFFDSGLGGAESFDLASLVRPRKKDLEGKSVGGGNRRIYLERLKTTLVADQVDAILAEPELRSRFMCQELCCRWRGWEGLADRARPHYLRVRMAEVAAIAALPTSEMRIHYVHQQLVRARDDAQVVQRMLAAHPESVPDLAHLERWIAVLTRASGAEVAA